jgi:hypothetical protein
MEFCGAYIFLGFCSQRKASLVDYIVRLGSEGVDAQQEH